MASLKHIMRRAGPRAIAAWSAMRYIRMVSATGNWSIEEEQIPQRILDRGSPFIVAFWHGRLLMTPIAWKFDRQFHMVISQHPDGQLITRTVAYLGIRTIAGSTTRGGSTVVRAMHRALEAGGCVGITPDGPRGPRMRAGVGIVSTARLSGVPILPVGCAASPRKLMGSWDRLMVPFPFGRGIIRWGEPINVPRDADDRAVETARRTLEDRLNEMTRALDRRLGREVVEPDLATTPREDEPQNNGIAAR